MMQQILKRLELIKTSIAIEDEEIIELQVTKLSVMSIDGDVQNILTKLSNSDYGSAVVEIENYLSRYSGVTVYEDKELGGLKLELKVLEVKLQELSEEKNDYLNEMNEFNVQYNLHLGDIIRKILELKKEILYRQTTQKKAVIDEAQERRDDAQSNIDELKEEMVNLKRELDEMDALDDDYDEIFEQFKNLKETYKEKLDELNKLQEEVDSLQDEFQNSEESKTYEEAKNDYESFSSDYEEIVKEERFELNDEELQELKRAYRKASKLCHPDTVSDELRAQAVQLFQELNEANSKKDLKKVLEILDNLENGNGLDVASDRINDKERLRAKIEEIRSKIDALDKDIKKIKSDDTFVTLQELDDWDEYFNTLKSELDDEKERLEIQINTPIVKEVKQPSQQAHDDDYWSREF